MLSWQNFAAEHRELFLVLVVLPVRLHYAPPRRVLITTDVWARGIDVQQVSLVINYDLPA